MNDAETRPENHFFFRSILINVHDIPFYRIRRVRRFRKEDVETFLQRVYTTPGGKIKPVKDEE